ncbi:MAG: C4-dicarboxylate TRAP transporter substrate-binding protein [Ectothiorhodospiraceae bacterium]|nr:C4-dicarboxylate TRAP transporter substrate-binding protein [Ectothiorhodospiraceae bacterium]
MGFSKYLSGLGLSAALASGVAFSSTADAQQFRFALGFPSASDATIGANLYAEKVEEYSDGELSVRVFPLSLLNFAETSSGVRDGIADIGYMLTPYFPQEFPHTNLLAEASMMLTLMEDVEWGTESYAYTGALLEYVMKHCPECHEEFARQNQVFTGTAHSPPYILQCTSPIRTLEEVRGKRIRVGGAQWSRWAEGVGASPVSISVNEAFEALTQGVVDCIAISAPELINFGLVDAVTDITMGVPGGLFAGVGTTNFNRDTWQGLSDEHRGILLRAAADISGIVTYRYAQSQYEGIDQAKAKGATIHEAADSLTEATREFTRKDLDSMAEHYRQRHGVQRGEEMISAMRELLEKWKGLVDNIESGEQLAQLYWDEVLSKVDPALHGM